MAHINRSDDSDKKPFGSTFWHNGARATWNVKRSTDGSQTGTTIDLGFYNRKANLGPQLPAVGLQVTFDSERTLIRRSSLADVDDLLSEMPLWQRIERTIVHRPKALHELATELNEKPESIKKTIQRSKLFTGVTDPGDRVTKIALVRRDTDGSDR